MCSSSSTGHPYFVGVQYHPEYLSRPMKPAAPYLGLILAATGKLSSFITNGCRMSPRNEHFDLEYSDTEEDLPDLTSSPS